MIKSISMLGVGLFALCIGASSVGASHPTISATYEHQCALRVPMGNVIYYRPYARVSINSQVVTIRFCATRGLSDCDHFSYQLNRLKGTQPEDGLVHYRGTHYEANRTGANGRTAMVNASFYNELLNGDNGAFTFKRTGIPVAAADFAEYFCGEMFF